MKGKHVWAGQEEASWWCVRTLHDAYLHTLSIKSFLQAINARITHKKVNVLKCMYVCSVMSDSATPWTVAHQGPLSIGLSQQEYWSRWPFPPQEDFPDPEMEPVSPAAPALAGRVFSTEPSGKFWNGFNVILAVSITFFTDCLSFLPPTWILHHPPKLFFLFTHRVYIIKLFKLSLFK